MSRILLSFRASSGRGLGSPLSATIRTFCSSSSSSSSSDDEKTTKKSPVTHNKQDAINKLNTLLQQLVETDQQNKYQKLNLAKPKGRNAKTESGLKTAKVESVELKMVSAVKDVAESIGGNKHQIESELLNRLLSNSSGKMPSLNLSDIIQGMKIDREIKADKPVSKARQVKKLIETAEQRTETRQRKFRTPKLFNQAVIDAASSEKVDIFGAEPLGIFTTDSNTVKQNMNPYWDKLYERELKLSVTHPPQNYFQEQILWTEQGKIWKFPIDNEQGMEEEQSVDFAEHIFLEEYLSPWCPDKGPLRHFMELVCVGLSKNPYMSVKDKRDHIKWFEAYFEEKKKILMDTGAIPASNKSNKQLESE